MNESISWFICSSVRNNDSSRTSRSKLRISSKASENCMSATSLKQWKNNSPIVGDPRFDAFPMKES